MDNKPQKTSLLFATVTVAFATILCTSTARAQVQERNVAHLPYIVTETQKQEEAKNQKKCQKPPKRLHFWGSFLGGGTKDKLNIVQLKGPNYGGQLGLDYKIEGLKVGAYIAGGHNRLKAPDSIFTSQSKGKTKSSNVFAFAAYYFSKEFFVNILGGYSYNQAHSNRVAFVNVHLKSRTNIFSVAPNLNYQKELGNFVGSFKLGYLYTSTDRKKATDSTGIVIPKRNVHLSSGNFLADLGYAFRNLGFANKIVPYIQGGINHDFKKVLQRGQTGVNIHRDQDAYLAGSGIRVYFKKDVTLSAGWTIVTGNSKKVNNSAIVTLRVGAF